MEWAATCQGGGKEDENLVEALVWVSKSQHEFLYWQQFCELGKPCREGPHGAPGSSGQPVAGVSRGPSPGEVVVLIHDTGIMRPHRCSLNASGWGDGMEKKMVACQFF